MNMSLEQTCIDFILIQNRGIAIRRLLKQESSASELEFVLDRESK